jgi:hypothetical protein
MAENSLPGGASMHGRRPPTNREIRVDERYARLLADDLGVKETTASAAFIGEPLQRALGVVAWAHKHAPEDPGRRARMILAWAKKRRAGAFREDEDGDEPILAARVIWGEVPAGERREGIARERERTLRLAKALAEMWAENPDSLAAAIRALEADRNGGRR